MWKTLSLILPVMIPSWRFFSAVQPSPRVQFARLTTQDADPTDWQTFRPRPPHVSVGTMLGRLVWNPDWNDTLFVVSCAERIQQTPTPHSIDQIQQQICWDIAQTPTDQTKKWARFRLVFVHRNAGGLSKDVVFLSDPFPIQMGQDH